MLARCTLRAHADAQILHDDDRVGLHQADVRIGAGSFIAEAVGVRDRELPECLHPTASDSASAGPTVFSAKMTVTPDASMASMSAAMSLADGSVRESSPGMTVPTIVSP